MFCSFKSQLHSLEGLFPCEFVFTTASSLSQVHDDSIGIIREVKLGERGGDLERGEHLPHVHVAHHGKEDPGLEHEVDLVTDAHILLHHQQFVVLVHANVKLAPTPRLGLYVLDDDSVARIWRGSWNCNRSVQNAN